MKEKMIKAFQQAEGGLFANVGKADVGNSYQEMEKRGVSLMGWADPFMPDKFMPQHIEKALIDAIKDGSVSHYTAPIGNEELKIKIAEKLKKQNGLTVDPKRNILITPGSDSGLFFSLLPFIEDGDEVIVPSPSYPNNFLVVEILGGKTVSLKLKEENNYQFIKEEFEELITRKTKAIVITHPNNPTTTVYNEKSLKILKEVVIKNDLILICDQAFEDYTYENTMITPASMDGMFDRTVTVFSFSKGMGLSGLRVGYIVCSDKIMDPMFANAVGVIGATSTSAQKGIIAALDNPSFMNGIEETFDYRRKKAYEILNSIPNVKCSLPESGFLCWLNVSKLGDSSEICDYLIKKAKIAVNDGKYYGVGGEGHLRIVLGVYKSNQKVVEALYKIKSALINYASQRKNM